MSSQDRASPAAAGTNPAARVHPLWIAAGIALLLAAIAWAVLRNAGDGGADGGPSAWSQPVPVRLEPARRDDFVVRLDAIGTVTPFNAVTVRARVPGQLSRVLVQEGQMVSRGQALAEIDPQPYRVRLAQAQGQQRQNRAQLEHAKSELARYRQLFDQDSIARQQVERQDALVNQLQGTLQADQAQVDDARLQLSYTRIEAPIAGRVGLRRLDAGNLVTDTDSEGLFTIVQTQPVSVVFSVPEPQVGAVRAAHRARTPSPVEAWDRNGARLLGEGRLDTLDNQIDIATGTLRLKARFENADDALFPNQFVNLRLALQTLPEALTVPADSVQYSATGPYLYVIADSKAQRRPVRLGASGDGRSVVVEGLAEGELVALEGLDRLEDGREVVVVDAERAVEAADAASDATAR